MMTKKKESLVIFNHKPTFYKKLEQQTKEWFSIREGVATGSVMENAMGSKTRQGTLAYELVSQKLIDDSITPEGFNFNDFLLQERINLGLPLRSQEVLDRGNELENYIFNKYSEDIDSRIEKVGFVKLNDYIGCSPDGLIRAGKDYIGAVEFKCPLGKNFIKYIESGGVPKTYMGQVLNYFICIPTLQYIDFVIYHPGASHAIGKLHIYKYTRIELQEDIEKARYKLVEFILMMQDIENNLSLKYNLNDMNIERDMWYNPKEVAKFLGLHQRTVQDKCRLGEIKSANISKIGAKRATYRIKGEHILDFLQ